MVRWNFKAILSWVDSHTIGYPTAINLNYSWSFGSTAGFCLLIQILSMAFLAMPCASETHCTFSSVEHITRDDIKRDRLIRFIYANGAFHFLFWRMLIFLEVCTTGITWSPASIYSGLVP